MTSNIDIDLNDYTAEDQEKLKASIQNLEQAQVIQSQIYELTDLCFSKCILKVRNPEDKNDIVCAQNCADRFLDVTGLVMKGFQSE